MKAKTKPKTKTEYVWQPEKGVFGLCGSPRKNVVGLIYVKASTMGCTSCIQK